ncbi:GPI transamidase component PIG-S [Trichinella spiralis]|uniref:GPI transamidase component PIG-S n=1 Tax=Trichinella spiralis TaxID=6334 RepID=A0A0V1ARP4_TRISP|nr:GPI transamidase component PIG-S [Trichinella spiralis]
MDEEVRREKVYSALSFVLFFAFILFPLWWKTTEVYRADLPYDEIHNLSKITFQLSIFVDLVWIDLSAKSSVERIQARLEEEYNSTQISDKMLLTYKYNARKIDDDELGKFFGDGNSSNLFNVESASADLLGSVRVIFVSDQIAQLFGEEVDLFLGCHQQASLFVRVQLDEEEILRKLTQTLKGVIFNEQRLEWIVAKAFHRSVEHDESVGKLPTTLTVVNPLRNEYALELFIVEPTPSGPVHGDTNAELEMPLLDKFLSRLSLVTKVSMNSQVLYGIDFPVLPERDPRGDYFYYDSKRLPYLINPMESFMGSYVTTLPVVHLLVYLTPDVHRPLYILDPTGVGSLYNSFVVAGWGGVTVVNTAVEVEDTSKLSLSDKLNSTDSQLALIALLRQYFGIDDSTTTANPGQDWLRLKRRQAALCPWQLQTLALHTWVDSTLDALVTVGSLLRLLERISNIVIDDHVADSIAEGVAQLSASVEASGGGERGGGLAEAVASSCRAAGAFEAAFFDHSLLSLLYFPDDQKYAIYTPLFLPLSLPVFISVRQILSYYCRSYASGGKVEKE